MGELKRPDGYQVKDTELGGREFTFLYNPEGKLVLALPKEHCSDSKIEEVVRQTQVFT